MSESEKAADYGEPWVQLSEALYGRNGVHLGCVTGASSSLADDIRNAARVVACVNACKDAADPKPGELAKLRAEVERGDAGERLSALQASHDRLVVLVKDIRGECDLLNGGLRVLADAALAAAEPLAARPTTKPKAPTCPGPDCPACSGEACALCGAGMHTVTNAEPCEHDSVQRHQEPPLVARKEG